MPRFTPHLATRGALFLYATAVFLLAWYPWNAILLGLCFYRCRELEQWATRHGRGWERAPRQRREAGALGLRTSRKNRAREGVAVRMLVGGRRT